MRWGTNGSQTKQVDEEKKKINHRPKHPTSHPTHTPQQLRWIEAAAGTQPAAPASANRVPPGPGRSPGATSGPAGRPSGCSHPAPLGCLRPAWWSAWPGGAWRCRRKR